MPRLRELLDPRFSAREFVRPREVQEALAERGAGGLGPMLYSEAMKGEFVVERFALKANAVPEKTWRERILGWGLIQMQFNSVHEGALRASFTNHGSESRARAWEDTLRQLPPVEGWDFREVTRVSRRINRQIARIAVRRDGARPILPAADAMVRSGGIVLTAG